MMITKQFLYFCRVNKSCTHNFVQFQAFDFRTTVRNEPFLQLFHCLYVYPLTVNLSRKRNLFIRIELRKDDTDIRKQPLEVSNCITVKYIFWIIATLTSVLIVTGNVYT